MSAVRVYYYGCSNREAGHYLHVPGMETNRETRNVQETNPWGLTIDAGIHPPRGDTCVGLGIPENAKCLHRAGWTALAFWDNTVDTRPGSCVTLLANGHYSIRGMYELFENAFPEVWKRLHARLARAPEPAQNETT